MSRVDLESLFVLICKAAKISRFAFVNILSNQLMIIKCVVIDNVYSVLFQLHEWIERFPFLRIVEMFDNRNSAEEFLKTNQVDLLLTFSDKDDVSWIKRIRSRVGNLFVIIMRDSEERISWKKEQLNLCYLRKPLELSNFEAAINQSIDYYQNREGARVGNLYVRSEYKLIKIEMDAIEYIESVENYLRINLNNEKPVMTLMTWKELFQKISKDRFIRIHRKYVIPVSKIKWVRSKKVLLPGIELPISDSYLPAVKNYLNK
ncbi:LytR/AlgR family response regulator transcription factor [Flavitalea sp.]|nr:LytTR family transcriptional regulator DNA-binding domain-containing protein [Flavitalea sp.]